MNVNEWGIYFAFSTGFNMAGFVDLTIIFTKPDCTTLTKTNPQVTCPNTDLQTTAGLFAANEYVLYQFEEGDVDQAGPWSAIVEYEDASQFLISNTAYFCVNAQPTCVPYVQGECPPPCGPCLNLG